MERLFSDEEIQEHLKSTIKIKNSSEYNTLADMYISEDCVQKYTANIHHQLNKYGKKDAFKKILNIMRVNPLVGMRIFERCELNVYAEDIYTSTKILVLSLFEWDETVFLNQKIPFAITLIEAAFSDICVIDIATYLLSFVKAYDKNLYTYKQWDKPHFLTPQNIRHIFQNIPSHKQIELINWFWRQHIHAVAHYQKIDTYSSRCVDSIMKAMYHKSLWSHFENEKFALSEEEQFRAKIEKDEVFYFIQTVMQNDNKQHLPYIKNLLGSENFLEKFKTIMGCSPHEMGCPNLEEEIDACVEKMCVRKEEGRRVYERRQRQRIRNAAKKTD